MFSLSVEGVSKEVFSINEVLEDLRRELIIYADEVFEFEKKSGFTDKPRIIVDGKFNKPIEGVRPFGKIEYINTATDFVEEIIMAFDEIEKRSPRGVKNPGDKFSQVKYRNFNYVYFNRKLVAKNRLELRRWAIFASKKGFSRGDEIAFVNLVPYARKLERLGVVRGKERNSSARKTRSKKSRYDNSKVSLPSGVYFQAQRSISRIFRKKAFVKPVIFEPLDVQIGGMRNRFAKARTKGGVGRPYLYPMIRIYPIVD